VAYRSCSHGGLAAPRKERTSLSSRGLFKMSGSLWRDKRGTGHAARDPHLWVKFQPLSLQEHAIIRRTPRRLGKSEIPEYLQGLIDAYLRLVWLERRIGPRNLIQDVCWRFQERLQACCHTSQSRGGWIPSMLYPYTRTDDLVFLNLQ
jgi:hypothetical protein